MAVERPLPQFISDQIDYLLSHSPLQIKVDQIWASSTYARLADRFTLSIPFCLDYVNWEFLYSGTYPYEAPDIIFPEGEEGFSPLVMITDGGENGEERKSCLRDWDCKDPTRLLALVHEMRDLYFEYQKKQVSESGDERLKFEAGTILTREGIEVCVISELGRLEEVKFAVPLLDTMDLNKLVPGCLWKSQQKIYLQVVFPVSRGYSSAPSTPRRTLVSSPELKSLFNVEDVKLPQWVDGMCMAEYLPTLEDNLRVQLMEAVAAIGSRRRFIEALAPSFGRPVEADSVFAEKHQFLLSLVLLHFWSLNFAQVDDNQLFGIVHFSIPTQFPRAQPILMLQSCQHFNIHGLAMMSPPINDYPWSPRWDASEMAQRIFEFIVDESLNFKKHCTDSSPMSQ